MVLNDQPYHKEKEETFTTQDDWEYTKYEGNAGNIEEEPEFDLFGTALNEI